MFIARTVVVIVALCAGGFAASPANAVHNELSVPSGTAATLGVARPSFSHERTPTTKPAASATASKPVARRVTAQK